MLSDIMVSNQSRRWEELGAKQANEVTVDAGELITLKAVSGLAVLVSLASDVYDETVAILALMLDSRLAKNFCQIGEASELVISW